MLDRLIDRIADRVVAKLEANKPQPVSNVFNISGPTDPQQVASDVARKMGLAASRAVAER